MGKPNMQQIQNDMSTRNIMQDQISQQSHAMINNNRSKKSLVQNISLPNQQNQFQYNQQG